MKIIHVTAGIQETCGVSQYVVNTARAQQAAGHDVTIITTMTCGYPVADLKVILVEDPVEALSTFNLQPSTRIPNLQPSTFNLQPLIVHIHSMWNTYIHRAAVWCRQHGVPYVASPHGSLTPWAMHYKWWKKLPAWYLYQRADFKAASGFHVTVPDEEADVRRYGFTQPLVIAPLGAEVPIFQIEKVGGESRWTEDGQIPFRDVVFLSRIHPKKNIPALLYAWRLVNQTIKQSNNQTIRLIIAGSDDVGHQEELVTLAKELGLRVVDFSRDLEFGKKTIQGGGEVPVETFQKRLADCDADVVFTGPVYSAAKDWMFAHAWVSVLPSHSENFGGVVVESLAQGTPVIASTGTPWQILETGVKATNQTIQTIKQSNNSPCGWWVDPTPEKLAEALKAALALSPEEREVYGQRARDLVREKFSWKSSADKVLELYEKVVEERKR